MSSPRSRSFCLAPLALALACEPRTRSQAPEPWPELDLHAALSSPGASASPEALRVLVTGFNDWKDLGEPPNVWRCRDNPSCRLLLGDEVAAKPSAHAGPLVELLTAQASTPDGRPIAWTFATMPVTWGIAQTLPDYESYDVVVHLGLGVYDRFDKLLLEDGAFNERKGKDAAARERHEAITAAQGQVLEASGQTDIATRVRALDGQTFGAYRLEVARAREQNSYLCNETHYLALSRVNESVEAGARLRHAYFLHIPYAEENDYARLAQGVAGVVVELAR